MNSLDTAVLLPRVREEKDRGFVALATVQLLGVVLAIGLTFYMKDSYTPQISYSWYLWMQIVVWVVLALTIVIAALQKDLAPILWDAFGGSLPGPSFLYRLDLDRAHLIYFLADFGALAFLIYATGGPQYSLYATFLFVIVPISIALGKPNLRTVVLFAGITLFIFLTLLWLGPRADFTPPEDGNRARKLWLGLVTTACVVFPTLVFCIQNWRSGDTVARARPHQTEARMTLTSSGDV